MTKSNLNDPSGPFVSRARLDAIPATRFRYVMETGVVLSLTAVERDARGGGSCATVERSPSAYAPYDMCLGHGRMSVQITDPVLPPNVRSGFDRDGSRDSVRFHPVVAELLARHARDYASPDRPSFQECHQRLVWDVTEVRTALIARGEDPGPTPSIATFRRRVRDLPQGFVLAGHFGRAVAARLLRRLPHR